VESANANPNALDRLSSEMTNIKIRDVCQFHFGNGHIEAESNAVPFPVESHLLLSQPSFT
jgi:hypothetical protein